MNRMLHIVMAVAGALLLTGCPVHQWPEPPHRDNTMVLHLHYEPDMWVWPHTYDPKMGQVEEVMPDGGVDDDHPGTSERYANVVDHGTMRIVVRVSRADNADRFIGEFNFTRDVAGGAGYDCDLELAMDAGDYVFTVWSDLSEDSSDVPFYDPSDFRRILMQRDGYRANSDHRDAFRGRRTIHVVQNPYAEEPERYEVTMRRPAAKYEFVTTDLSEFLEREGIRRNLPSRADISDYVVEVAYAAYLPSSYSAVDDRLENAVTGVRYESQVRITGENEATIGFDYVLINETLKGESSGVLAEVSVYDMEGERVAHSQQFTVPLRRNHHTVLRGAFFSVMAQGGVGVDPSYDGDYNVGFGF